MWMACTAYNEHIAKIAALPRVDRFCVFSLPLVRVDKVLEYSNFGNMQKRYTSARFQIIITSESVFWAVFGVAYLKYFPLKKSRWFIIAYFEYFPVKPGCHVFCSFTAKKRASPLFVFGFRGQWNRSCYFSGLLGEIRKWRMWCFPVAHPPHRRESRILTTLSIKPRPTHKHHIRKDVM